MRWWMDGDVIGVATEQLGGNSMLELLAYLNNCSRRHIIPNDIHGHGTRWPTVHTPLQCRRRGRVNKDNWCCTRPLYARRGKQAWRH